MTRSLTDKFFGLKIIIVKIPQMVIKKPYCPHFCIEIDDMNKSHSDLIAMNIRIVKGPLKIENEEAWIYFADEDHNVLEYIQWFNKK